MREIVQDGNSASLVITGNSMAPFLIHLRDTAFIKSPDRPLRTGDIVFYQRSDERFILHRIVRVYKNSEGKRLFAIAGDNHSTAEYGVCEEQIFAFVCAVRRKGKILKPGDFRWDFFEKVWPRIIPARRMLIRMYSLFARRREQRIRAAEA